MPSLNEATKIRVGNTAVSRVYVGNNLAWPPWGKVAGLVGWYDASSLPLGALYYWPNLYGSAHNAWPDAAGPTVVASGLNGLNCLQFNTYGTGGVSTGYSGIHLDYTIFMVAGKWTTGRVMSGNGPNILFGFWGDYEDCFYAEPWVAGPTAPHTGAWKLYSADANSTYYYPRFFSMGGLLGSNIACAVGWNYQFYLGGHGGGTEKSACNIAEIILFDRQIADGDRAQVEAYLYYKWFN